MTNKIFQVETTKGTLNYQIGQEGGIEMLNPQTIQRYRELRSAHPDADKYGVFFAFSNAQFERGYDRLVELGKIKEGETICQAKLGLFGKREDIDAFYRFYDDIDRVIAEECDPQEIYFHEYNNYECMLSHEDDQALLLVAGVFGNDAARKITRRGLCGTPTEELLKD